MSSDATAKPPASTPIDGLPPELRRWAVAAIFTALALASLDIAIANTALPTIAADLQASPAASVWVVNAYQLALVLISLLPLGGAGRDHRLPHHLYRRAGAVHRRLGGLRHRLVAAQPDRGAGAAGLRRQRHHEREHGADPLHLPDPAARPRHRLQHADRRHLLRRSARRSRPASWPSPPGNGCSRSTCRSA